MTGLKSGSGDDLWGDEDDAEEMNDESTEEQSTTTEETEQVEETPTESKVESDTPTTPSRSTNEEQPYIVRRAIQNKSVQFEREERLTFFVHDDVVEGERELITQVESALGRDVPKFDVREAVYRTAIRNPEDILDELLKMGYALDEK